MGGCLSFSALVYIILEELGLFILRGELRAGKTGLPIRYTFGF
jgi:hypothetical protein